MTHSPLVVRVETVELDGAGGRQISAKHRGTSLFEERADEIKQGIQSAVEVVRDSLADQQDRNGWRVSSVEATFGITLSAEAGVILSKASAEATFEVTLTVERA